VNPHELLASRDAAREPALWAELRRDGAPAAREALFDLYLPFARKIARQQFHEQSEPDLEFGDLFQLACAGLLEAIDRFEPDRDVPFQGFATRRIAGSILDSVAHFSELREQKAYQNRLRTERMRSVSPDENIDRLTSADAKARLVELAIGLALGFMLEGTGLYHDETRPAPQANPYDSASWKEAMARLSGEVDALGGRERSIIHHHYAEGLTFEAIARLLGLSKTRIWQLHGAALTTLRKRLLSRRQFNLKL